MTKLTGEQLRALRLSAEWEQSQMGDALGFTAAHVCNIEKGVRELPEEFDMPTVKTLMVARILRVKTKVENWRC